MGGNGLSRPGGNLGLRVIGPKLRKGGLYMGLYKGLPLEVIKRDTRTRSLEL